jgi:hypothetical protein
MGIVEFRWASAREAAIIAAARIGPNKRSGQGGQGVRTVEQLNSLLAVAESLGYGIRFEWLGGRTGGACEIAGKRWLFVDLALNPVEQLDQVTEALRQDAAIHTAKVPPAAREALGLRKAA